MGSRTLCGHCILLVPHPGKLYLNESRDMHLAGHSCSLWIYYSLWILITEEGFLVSPCSLELCIQMGVSFLFPFAFCFSSFLSYLYGLLRQPFCLFAFLFLGDGLDNCLLYDVMNLRP